LIVWLADKVLKVVDNESYKKESLELVMKII